MAVIHFAAIMWTKAWVHMQTILRGNLLVAQMASGGPRPASRSDRRGRR